MRKMPHKMGRHLLEERRKGCAEARARYAEERPLQERRRNTAFFAGHLDLAIGMARLDYLFGASVKTIRAHLAEGLQAWSLVVQTGGTLDGARFPEILGAALLAGDGSQVAGLASCKVAGLGPMGVAMQAGALGDREGMQAPDDLLQAIAEGDQVRLDRAWESRATSWAQTYDRPSQRGNEEGILDLVAIGLGIIAGRFGMKIPRGNPYAPLELMDAGAGS